jgi:serine/threonine protein kinase
LIFPYFRGVTDTREHLASALGSSYTIERELGGGGMSKVFLAHDESLGRDVVVKVLAPELIEGRSAERFTREIKLAAALQEPHIVPVLSAGTTQDGVPYYCMPFVRGESLRARLDRGKIPVTEATGILRNVLSALSYAHGQGVVHRDIKPENILISSGTAVVTDFGIAKALQASRTPAPGGTLTQIGTSLGTPAYMAPEQAAGDPDTDHRADIYALGVIAYEMLSGRHPFAGKTSPRQLMTAHIAENPTPLDTAAPGVPRALSALVMRALAKEPDNRLGSADQMLNELNASVSAEQVSSIPSRNASRRYIWAALAVAVIAIAAGLTIFLRARGTENNSGEINSLAVLPFENVGGDTANVYFAEGMTDELATALARVPELTVASRTSSYAFKNRSGLSTNTIASRLHVGAVLDGSVRRAGQQVRVSAQLTRANDERVIWADAFTVDAADVFAVQARLAQSIVAAISSKLAGKSAEAKAAVAEAVPTRDPVAYDLYLRARYKWNQRGPSVLESIDLFKQAVARDPTFARAWAGLASAWAVLPAYDSAYSTQKVLVPTLDAAHHALALDSLLGEVYTATGYAYANADSVERGRLLLLRGAELDPHSITALGWMIPVFRATYDYENAEAVLRRAIQIDPLSGITLSNLAVTLAMVNKIDEARVVARRAATIDPLNSGTLNNSAVALAVTGNVDEAQALQKRAEKVAAYLGFFRGNVNVAAPILMGRDSVQHLYEILKNRPAPLAQRLLLAASLGYWDEVFKEAPGVIAGKNFFFDIRWKPVAHDPRLMQLCQRTKSDHCDALIRFLDEAPDISQYLR